MMHDRIYNSSIYIFFQNYSPLSLEFMLNNDYFCCNLFIFCRIGFKLQLYFLIISQIIYDYIYNTSINSFSIISPFNIEYSLKMLFLILTSLFLEVSSSMSYRSSLSSPNNWSLKHSEHQL